MATNFNVVPYYDDFDASKDFHRVLFRPGFSVQARELTQLQTILQKQLERFGSHMFEEGSMVIPGDLNYDLEYDFVKLQPTYNGTSVETYRAELLDKIISNTNGLKARVIGSTAVDGTDPITLYIKYENTSTSDNTTKVFARNQVLTITNANNTTTTNTNLTSNQTTEYSVQTQDITTAVGTGSAIRVNAGAYYVLGNFVANTEQTILLDKYTNTPSYRIGFTITESFVTPEDDTSLTDNARGSTNENAPGAHRYKILLTLVKKTLTDTDDDDFIELARIKSGEVKKFVKYADYSQLEHTFARRTFDESGSYEVRPFLMDVREHLDTGSNRGIFTSGDNGGDATKVALGVEPGKAYVEGYELETMTQQILPADKPRTFDRVTDRPIQTPVGNHVLVETVVGIPDIDSFESVNLKDKLTSDSPSTIGTARVRSFQLHDGDYTGTLATTRFKLGLFDIQMNSGKDFARDVKGLANGDATFTCNVDSTDVLLTGTVTTTSDPTVTGQGTLFSTELKAGDYLIVNGVEVGVVASVTNNLALELAANASSSITAGQLKRFSADLVRPDQKVLVYDTNYFRVRKIRGDSTSNPDTEKSTAYTVRRKFATATISTAAVSYTVAGADETFTSVSDLSNYTLVIKTASSLTVGDILDIGSGNLALSNSNRTLTISGLTGLSTNAAANGDTVDLIASVRVSGANGVEKSKTLVENATVTVDTSAAAGKTVISLGKADGFALKSIKMAADFSTAADSADPDITNRYDFDNGQRDSFYDLATVKLKPGQPVPSGRLLITFDHFTHGAGDYFSVDSYAIDYENIPSYVSAEGKGRNYDLRDSLDFRPRINDAGTGFTGTGASATELPKIGTNVEADFSFFLPRKDKVFLDRLGKFNVISGLPAIDPELPQDPDSGMTLFEVSYHPYVISLDEVKVRKLDNRRYTMRDIGKLDKRISNLEYYTSLNLLEKETADLVIQDSDGNDRLKNGFIVDNFTGHIIGDINNTDYRIGIDMKRRELRPMAFSDVVDMVESVDTTSARTAANYVLHSDGIITLPFTDEVYIENAYASGSFDVNPYKVAPFTGEIVLTPYSDDWQDVTRRPDVIVQDDNNFDVLRELADEVGITGTIWNNWQDNWFGARENIRNEVVSSFQRQEGRSVFQYSQTREVATQQVGQIRSGLETSLQSTIQSNNLGDRIVSLSMIPFMRSRPVTVQVGNMRPNTQVFAFFDNVNVSDHVQPADVFAITGTYSFNDMPLSGSQTASDSARSFDGDQVQAFSIGDVVKNTTHTATTISGVAQSSGTVTITVAATTGLAVGHHVQITSVVGSTELNFTASKANSYKIASIPTSTTITITDLDDTAVETLTSYTSGGSLQRLQASGVVIFQKPNGTDINVVNIKNGFAIADTLTGTLLNSSGAINTATIGGINGTTSGLPTMKAKTDTLIVDDNGTFDGVFFIPNTDTLRFRTGERVFRLIDEVSNNPETGNHSSKAEKIYRATGIAEEREQTILNVRRAEFVRDRVQDTQIVSRDVRGALSTNRTLIRNLPDRDNRPGPRPQRRHDPLGQTFINQGDEGAFITKIDLYFAAVGQRPVTVQLVNTVDGHPSLKVIAQKTLQAGQITASTDATTATTFTFSSPVYLKDDVEYAILIKVDEPGTKVWFSEVGATNVTDNRLISSNPLQGTLFLSQNGQTFTPHQYKDLKFTMYRAKFSTSLTGTPTFVNNAVSLQTLETDPFEVNTGTATVRVTQKNHGFTNGDKVTISGVANGFYGANSTTIGIPATELNDSHTIANATIDTYTIGLESGNITTNTNSLIQGFVGGSGIKATRNIAGDIIQASTSQIKLPDTTLSYAFTGMTTDYTKQTAVSILENSNYYPTARHIVASEENQDTNLNGRATDVLTGTSSKLVATLSTTNDFVSPVLDSQRISLCLTSNRISNVSRTDVNVSALDDRTAVSANNTIIFSATNSTISTANAAAKLLLLTLDEGKEITASGASNSNNNITYTVTDVSTDGATVTVTPAPGTNESASSNITIVQHEHFLNGIAPTGATCDAKYVTKRFSLENPSTALKIQYEMNRPGTTTVNVYYKIVEDGDTRSFDDIPYVLTSPDTTDSADEIETIFRERSHTVSSLNTFATVAIKVEMKSTNTCQVPKLKNLRVLALAL